MMLLLLPKIFLLILLTDLITGTVHWWEDTYGNPDWPWIGKSIVFPNIEHHQFPRKFLKHSFFERIKLSLAFAIGLILFFYVLDMLSWEIVFVLLYSSLGNECHAVSHRTDKENGKFIGFLQKIGLIQSRKMHGYHHSAPYDTNYCVQTNYLNPILNYLHFWENIERLIAWFGIKPKRGSANRNGY